MVITNKHCASALQGGKLALRHKVILKSSRAAASQLKTKDTNSPLASPMAFERISPRVVTATSRNYLQTTASPLGLVLPRAHLSLNYDNYSDAVSGGATLNITRISKPIHFNSDHILH